jgi:serine/threonine-protein kinase
MGVVYLAEHPVIGRQVAVKLLHVSFSKDAEIVARFFNEAKAIHMIHHENIVEILDFGQTADGQPYFIMEYLTGQPLADRIARGPVSPAETVEIGQQICAALQAAHDKGIVHRDLKPHNIYVLEEGDRLSVKILDFGVAKVSGWDAGAGSVKTRTGSLMGTPLYMSPEQCRGSGKLDHRTDIYSLGVILFEMLVGQPPFNAEGVGELFAKHMLEAPPNLLELAPQTPPALAAAVMHALNKNLDDRFATMSEFRTALLAKEGDGIPPFVRTMSKAGRADGARVVSIITHGQSTTLSSGASELDDPSLKTARNRKGLVTAGIVGGALAGVLILILSLKGPAPAPVAPPPSVAPAVPASPPPAPPAPKAVTFAFDVTPKGAHVVRRADGKDFGEAPLAVELPATENDVAFAVELSGYKTETVTASAAQDHRFSISLTPEASAEVTRPADATPKKEAEKKTEPRKRRAPATVRRASPSDEDGLAVPTF